MSRVWFSNGGLVVAVEIFELGEDGMYWVGLGWSWICSALGSYHFLQGRLFVMAGRHFFLVPLFGFGEKFWSPPPPRE